MDNITTPLVIDILNRTTTQISALIDVCDQLTENDEKLLARIEELEDRIERLERKDDIED